MSADVNTIVRANLARVRERIARACDAAGRSIEEVTLVGVSKYVDAAKTAALFEAGCHELGEARPQQLWAKADAPELRDIEVRWRLIGHLQRNKAERTVACAHSIDSVDSRRLIVAIDKAAAASGKRLRVLLEVNCSGDPEKHGLKPDDAPGLLAELGDFPNVEVLGLMTMAAREGGEAVARANFAKLRELRDELLRLLPEGHSLDQLSMGMSGDLEAAIMEGSTHVRVGSALWAGLE